MAGPGADALQSHCLLDRRKTPDATLSPHRYPNWNRVHLAGPDGP